MTTQLSVTPTGQACGAIVRGVDLRTALAPATVAAIRAAWMEHHVLAFPDQVLDVGDLERFARSFGPAGDDPFFGGIDGNPHIAAIHRAADETGSIFAENWHADWSFQAHPPDGTCLYGKVIPPTGGDTLFADQEAALAAMPSDLRAELAGLRAIHSARNSYAPDGLYGDDGDRAERAMDIKVGDEAYETQLHDLVRVHPETGRETVYSTVGYIIGIEGMDRARSDELLRRLYHWQTRDEFQYRHRWEPDMLVMWDNRCILHRATGGYEGHERLLHRITIGYDPEVNAAPAAVG
ncbi:MAG: TauD/TfdA family dioxygenase [Actinomycetota bacterium]